MTTTWRVRSSGLAVATILLLSACGGSSDGSASGSSGSGSSGKGCDKAPAALVNQHLGTSYGQPEVNDNGSVVVCTYRSTSGTGTGMVRFETGSSSLAAARSGFTSTQQTTKDLAGVGDEAFSSTLTVSNNIVPPTNTVVVRKGSTTVLITSQASVDKESSLATALLG